MSSTRLDLRVEQQLANPQRRARDESRSPLGEHPEVDRMEPVHVFTRRHVLDDGALVDVSGQRHLDEDSMHHRVIVKPIDRGQQLSLGRLGGKAQDGAIHSGRRAGFLLTSDIDAAGRVITDEDDTQARDHGGTRGELLDLRRDLTANLVRQRFSIDDLSSHGVPLLGGEVLSAGKGIFPDLRLSSREPTMGCVEKHAVHG